MTVSKVTQANMYAGVGVTALGVSGSNQTDEFSRIFAAQSTETENKSQTKPETDVQKQDEGPVVHTEKTSDNESVNESETVNEVTDTEDMSLTEKEEPDAEQVEEAVIELLATIQQILGVSEEEIQSALEELGISAEELLSKEMIPQLVVALTEGADELSVMTDGDLFAKVQELTAKAEELLQNVSGQMNLTAEEWKEMLQSMSETESVLDDEVTGPIVTEDIGEVPGLEEVRVQAAVESPRESSRTEDGRQGTDSGANQQMTFAQTVVEQIEQAVAKVETSYSSSATTESILNQIQDAIHVIQRQDATEMELQLHPASLGHVRVQLTASEGVITATFTAENETVRSALEAQMLTLKQSFEEQGIKVEAVEVTVASHAFEHNLSGDENGAGEQATPEKKKSVRRISLSDLMNEVEEEELSDEDRIVAEMMKQNGNTVDYTV